MKGSRKRSSDEETTGRKGQEVVEEELEEELVFEDPFGDDYEEDEEDETMEVAESGTEANEKDTEVAQHVIKQVWRPGVDKLEDGEDLEYDPSAYIMYHSMQTEWPCLSFDFLKDTLGDNRQRV